MTATFVHMMNPYQLLVIPLTFWSGIEQAYFSSEFTRVSIVLPPGPTFMRMIFSSTLAG
jgi:hypothetical protein